MSKRADGEGSYYARPASQGGGWLYRVMVNGQRVSGSGPTKAKARARAEERARLVAPKANRENLEQLVDEWSALPSASVGLRSTTHDQYRSLLRSRVVPVLGSVKVSRLTPAQVADLFAAGTGTASTLRSTYAALVKVLDYAVRQQRVGTNVARLVERPAASESGHRGITQDEARRLVSKAAGHRYEVAVWLGLGAGLRRGEMLALRWSDVDLERGELQVVGNLTRSSAGLVWGKPKTKKGARHVPLSPAVVEALRAHRKRQVAERLAASDAWQGTDAVIANEAGGWVEPRALSRAWSGWARAAKVSDRGTHLGRHYAATTLLASGQASVADVAAQLGHDPAVLLNTYAVAVAEGQRRAADVLGASLTVPTGVPTDAGSQG